MLCRTPSGRTEETSGLRKAGFAVGFCSKSRVPRSSTWGLFFRKSVCPAASRAASSSSMAALCRGFFRVCGGP